MNVYSQVAMFHVIGWWAIAVPVNPNPSVLFSFIHHANPPEAVRSGGVALGAVPTTATGTLNNQVAHVGPSASISKHVTIIPKVGGEVKNFLSFDEFCKNGNGCKSGAINTKPDDHW